MNKKVTIRDVAELAGVSLGTASKVINNTGNVQIELKDKVNAAIKALQYSPNMIARSLKSSVSKTIAVLLSNLTNPFQMTLAKGIEEVIFEKDYLFIISSTNENPTIERKNLQMFYEQRVDGIILCSTGHVNEEIISLAERNIPIVLVDRPISHLPVNIVADDNFIGMEKLVTYLYELGHKEIGVVHGDLNTIHGRIRHKAVLQSLVKYGLSTRHQYIGDFTYKGGQNAVDYFLSTTNVPTAIITSNNNMTAGVLKACQNYKITIPEQLTVVSFGELEYEWDLIVPKVTSVVQSPREIGKKAATILLEQLKNGGHHQNIQIFIEPEIVIGNSSSPLH
ncbi:LacI family DNA-binding transcriptional regulator [Bacillus timonensis]|uniref:LacI family DNA-binding transcriptional regulator n=1 Tax=Bacillus timonensis TaxID=1033734 RepID=UPI000289B26E|nr:LacI family DNA-binding transcriptional regulator [Bacillus timonensis]